jgi:hypothetical protein
MAASHNYLVSKTPGRQLSDPEIVRMDRSAYQPNIFRALVVEQIEHIPDRPLEPSRLRIPEVGAL